MREFFTKLFWVTWVSTFTIEFAVVFSKMSHGVLGVLKTDLALAKVCLVELGHNETICSNLKNHPDIEVRSEAMVTIYGLASADLDCCTKASEHVGNVRGHFNAGTASKLFEINQESRCGYRCRLLCTPWWRDPCPIGSAAALCWCSR